MLEIRLQSFDKLYTCSYVTLPYLILQVTCTPVYLLTKLLIYIKS